MLESLLTGETVAAPPDLFREYGDILHDYARPVPADELRGRGTRDGEGAVSTAGTAGDSTSASDEVLS
jgi:hypothetical protein